MFVNIKANAFLVAENMVALMLTSLTVIGLLTFWGYVKLNQNQSTEQVEVARLCKEITDQRLRHPNSQLIINRGPYQAKYENGQVVVKHDRHELIRIQLVSS